ncbi:uncharacterized protein BDR25DRAFT_374887 [Lindgomyces ingoldianus]|uniref:Uncharacterized protein n=1 Tax=Lindgomyces ingoldianus TaxID=673940 RepID=A0ACB6QM10_9PLEO|nr:uncharacterized protein BDR25DRAFT_374887 [Lindgomyces ingoldianus]KAF2467560.1 hypothetical protein BDR25DRAFT_374887 [Lindgomyces ingoldianus]
MYRRDPIVSSSPMGSQAPRPSNSFTDSDDELADDFLTQPTLPLNPIRSSLFPPPTFVTQPTQVLPTTPKSNRVDRESQIQVARSSPAVHSPVISQRQLPYANPMAPPGTYLRRPPPAHRPIAIDLTCDDPPVEADPEEEDTVRSNIKPSRIEETPQKRPLNLSSFQYNPNLVRKRPADNNAGTLPLSKWPRSVPRQIGPARALPVEPDIDMELDDIPDFDMKRKVQRLMAVVPGKPVRVLYEALVAKRGNWDDAAELVTRDHNALPVPSSEDELLSSPKSQQPVKTAKRELNAPTKSIHEKFSTICQAQPGPAPENLPRRKGRLVRGRRNRSPTLSVSPQVPLRPMPRKVELEDEDEAIAISSDSDAEVSDDAEVEDDSLLDFFNTCSVEAMVDLSNQKEDDVRSILARRPFTSLTAVEKIYVDSQLSSGNGKKAKKPKIPMGERLVDSATSMWRGYMAIDQLVIKCEARGKTIAAAMAKWGVDVFGATIEGEVALTSLDDGSDTSSIRDSGIGTPRSSSDTEADTVQKGSRGKSTLLKKPSNMSPDLQLKDYQLVGLNWLNLLWQNGISGILADDMGLGKTCQVIAFLSHLRQLNVQGPHLIVVPGSTLENWLREFQRFSNKLVVEPYYGLQAAREEQQLKILDNRSTIDVIVTTYDLAFKKMDNVFLRKCRPHACIYDEGHVLRNSTTQRYQSLMRIPANFRLLLTGTPLQNNLRELASILAFIMPDIFKDVEDDLTIVFKHKAKTTDSDTHGALLSTQRIKRARSMMTPFILRRKKVQVLKHLPQKTCRIEYCNLTESQSKLYAEQIERQRQVLVDRAAGIQTKDHANVMMKLRQAAIHPLLFRNHYSDHVIRKMSKACLREEKFKDSDPNIIFEELQLYQDYQCHSLATTYPRALGKFRLTNDEWMDSGKIKKLAELLVGFKENGDRTLVFSQFTSVMDILEWVLDTLEMAYFRLDGQTPIAQRQDMLDQFYEDETIPVFMLSTKSGGAGINLACANKVIIFDSSFNPQDDIQAENRAHRVGQTRDVEVIRLVTKGTVEEQIHALGVSKLELDKMVAGEESMTDFKNPSEVKLSAAEEKGLEAVEDMLLEEFQKMGSGDKTKDGDLKKQYLDGLKKAGLDVAA